VIARVVRRVGKLVTRSVVRMMSMVGTWELCNSPLKDIRILLATISWRLLDVYVVELVPVVTREATVNDGILRGGMRSMAFTAAVRRCELAVDSVCPAPEWFPQDGLHGWYTSAYLARLSAYDVQKTDARARDLRLQCRSPAQHISTKDM